MSRDSIPSYRRQSSKKGTARAFVELNGQRQYLGEYGSDASRQAYDRAIAEWVGNGRAVQISTDQLTVTNLCARYWKHIENLYVKPANFRPALKVLRGLYGDTPAIEFGPVALKTVRNVMVQEGWCRKYVNGNVKRIQQVFEWAVSEEMIPSAVNEALKTVKGLRRGRTDARDHDAIIPAPDTHIDAIRGHVSRQVWAMVELQRLCGARPGEIVIMRPVDIDRSAEVWIYRPTHHKNAHRNKARVICFGPRAQAIINPFIQNREASAFIFDPREAERDRKAEMRLARRTPVQPSQADRSVDQPKRTAGHRYTTLSYARAVARGIKRAFRPEGMSNAEFQKWTPAEHWHPNQLRHNRATELRRDYGLEAAQVVLGHSKLETTQIYAEQDIAKAVNIARKAG